MNLTELDRALRQLRLSGHGSSARNPLITSPERTHDADRLSRLVSQR